MTTDGSGKGKGKICKPPPPKAKGAQKGHNSLEYGKEPTATPQDVTPLPKPQPEEALKLLARLQHGDGSWEPSEELALGLGLHVFALEIPRKPAQDVPAWSVVVSTTLACQALQRCISIIGSAKTDASAGRSEALAVAAEHSVLGSKVLDVAGEWLEAAWDKAKQHVRARQRHELDLKVKSILEELLPLPSWKEQLKAKMAIHKTCEVCGSEYTAAVGKCTRCFPPERPTVDVEQDNRKWRSLPPAPLHVDWQQCEGALHVEGGSGGVTLLHVGEGVLVLKKQRMTAAAEFLAIQVAKAIGIRVADMRLISWAEAEFQEINAAIRKTSSFEKNPLLGIWRSTEFLGILEYIPGCTVQGPEFQHRLQDMEPDSLQKFWFEVGEIIAYDALINNVDRIPLLWDNEGNTANLMLLDNLVKENRVVGIDQAVAPIVAAGPGRERFLSRLKELSEAVFRKQWQDSALVSSSLDKVSECFMLSCGVQVDKTTLMSGLLRGLTKVADLMEDGSLATALDEAIAAGRQIFRPATVDMGHKELPHMRDFILATAETIALARRAAFAA